MDSANAESQADSTIAKVAKHDFATIKLNRTKCQPLKALSGGGYIRGRGDFAIQTPPPYEKKKNNNERKNKKLRI